MTAPWRERLQYLANLPGGWYDGDGVKISKLAVTTTELIMTALDKLDYPPGNLFPIPDGGISGEWTDNKNVRTFEVMNDGNIELFDLGDYEAGELDDIETRDVRVAVDYIARTQEAS
ncbi:hypothetical protein [Pseudoclavibacter helvolus]|uniref:hypothetical protein n=1 Tax=Pseudoclavibacter helvolus TaxID=255205 RepID=UPI003C72248D